MSAPPRARETPAPTSSEPVSTLALQIVQAAVRPDITVGELSGLAQKDPGFAVRLLGVANSSAYGLARKVTDLRHAASLLGIRGMRNLALGLSLSDMAPLGPAGETLLAISLRRAVAARLVAERAGQKAPDELFTAGLLLELAILSRARADIDGAADAARAPAMTRPMRERAAGVPPHPVAGAELATSWKLADDVVEAILHHHDPTPPVPPIARVAWVAERVAAVFEGGELGHNRTVALDALAQVGLTGDVAESVLRDLPGTVAEAAAAFQRKIGTQPDIQSLLRDANASLLELNASYQDLVRTLEALVIEKEALAASLREANEKLEHLAAVDGLTGLLNRRSFEDALRRDLARAERAGTPIALVMVDVDHFKKVNDTHGHQVGDEVLKAVAAALPRSLREGDVVARYGGEELVVILPATRAEDSLTVAERLRAAIEKVRVDGAGGPFGVTASFGVAAAQGTRLSGEELVRRADEALYAAKRGGRNRVVLAA